MFLQLGDKARRIQHYVFSDWDAERDVPVSPERFLAFIEKVETSSGGPILLHCMYVMALIKYKNSHSFPSFSY